MKIISAYFSAALCCLVFSLQSKVIGQTTNEEDIISQSITNTELWSKVPQDFKVGPSYYILDHGVEFHVPQNFRVKGTPTFLIDKSGLSAIDNSPYFLFHTLEIKEQQALVRLYLVYSHNNEEKTISQELNFTKINNKWQLANSEF